MTKESGNHQYVSYPMFKGLQKPLELYRTNKGCVCILSYGSYI